MIDELSILEKRRQEEEEEETHNNPPASSKLNESDLSLVVSNRASYGRLTNINGAVLDSKQTSCSEETSNSSVLSTHQQNAEIISQTVVMTSSLNTVDLQLDTRIPNVFVSSNDEAVAYRDHIRTDFEQELADLSSLDDEQNHQDGVEEDELNKLPPPPPPPPPIDSMPKKRTAIIEVRPEYMKSSLIRISTIEQAEATSGQSIEMSCMETVSSSSNRSFHLHRDNEDVVKNSPRVSVSNRGQSSSPPPLPHFPAIGENEMSETHANYVVVRSGDIIEKNGIYYSSDGTIRGYSGTVKKMAGSKTLNEVNNNINDLKL